MRVHHSACWSLLVVKLYLMRTSYFYSFAKRNQYFSTCKEEQHISIVGFFLIKKVMMILVPLMDL